MSFIENPWLKCLVLQQCGHVQFPSHRQMVIDVVLDMVEKTKDKCVITIFASYVICTCSFDLWMSCAGFDTFVMVVNIINTSWEHTHATIGIFEVHNIPNVAMQIR
jgi:hypothetical protein